jgi:hypothetical protein
MKSICVFCGSSMGRRPDYERAAAETGRAIARSGRRLVYGGAKVGLMGVVADAALAEGGEVIGVLPIALEKKELAHEGLSALHVVSSMHERKAMMADLSDGFIALPGGAGTMEGTVRDLDLGPARLPPQALRPAQCLGLLRRAARLPRPAARRGVRAPGNAGDGRGGRNTRRIDRGLRALSGAENAEMDQAQRDLKALS